MAFIIGAIIGFILNRIFTYYFQYKKNKKKKFLETTDKKIIEDFFEKLQIFKHFNTELLIADKLANKLTPFTYKINRKFLGKYDKGFEFSHLTWKFIDTLRSQYNFEVIDITIELGIIIVAVK